MIVIKSFDEYIKVINQASDKLRCDLIRDERLLFRGHSDSSFKLLPSIARTEDKTDMHSLLWFEKEMIDCAIRKLPETFNIEKYPINLLTKLQHYGIPTRLLDLTYNSLVALYFACADLTVDGEVLVFQPILENEQFIYSHNSGIINVIANMYKIGKLSACTLERFVKISDIEKYEEFNMDGLREKDIISYKKRLLKWISFPSFVSARELTERQKRQQGIFLIFPNKQKKISEEEQYFMEAINPMEKDESPVIERIIVSKDSKSDIKKYLSSYGITEEFLFPDSIDIICKSIKNNAESRLG